jgi:hypothetical protein
LPTDAKTKTIIIITLSVTGGILLLAVTFVFVRSSRRRQSQSMKSKLSSGNRYIIQEIARECAEIDAILGETPWATVFAGRWKVFIKFTNFVFSEAFPSQVLILHIIYYHYE